MIDHFLHRRGHFVVDQISADIVNFKSVQQE